MLAFAKSGRDGIDPCIFGFPTTFKLVTDVKLAKPV
jgi:hypothetical protein